MQNILIDERPIVVQPSLIKLLGFPGAIIIQQIHWMCNQPRSGHTLDDGENWVWGTYAEWVEDYFPFWSERTLRHHIRNLEAAGYLLSCQPKKGDWDRTKSYRVCTEKVEESLRETMRQEGSDMKRMEVTKLKRQKVTASYTETSSETSTEKSLSEKLDIGEEENEPLEEKAKGFFNEVAERSGWPKVRALSASRKKAVLARIKELGFEGWKAAILKASQSDFLTGKTDNPFVASFDWLSKPTNMNKVIEGNYDNRRPKARGDALKNTPGGNVSGILRRIERRYGGS